LFSLWITALAVYFYTMLTTEALYELLDAKRVELGLSQTEVGRRALGHSSASALQNMKRGSSPTVENLSLICDVLGLDIQIGPRLRSVGGLSESDGETDFDKPTPARMGYLPIPWTVPGLGLGSAPISIQRDYLAKHGLIPDRLSAVVPDTVLLSLPVEGPFVAVLDARKARRGHGLWCFSEGRKTILAHITFDEGGMIISSPSPSTPAQLVNADRMTMIQLLGRVVMLTSVVGSSS
jgi:transcriptional regulator with XRE-family HTH domain